MGLKIFVIVIPKESLAELVPGGITMTKIFTKVCFSIIETNLSVNDIAIYHDVHLLHVLVHISLSHFQRGCPEGKDELEWNNSTVYGQKGQLAQKMV